MSAGADITIMRRQRDENLRLKEALRFSNFCLKAALAGLTVMTVGFLWVINLY